MKEVRVLGVDPGLTATGYGVVEACGDGLQSLTSGIVRPRAKDPLPKRLAVIHERLSEVMDGFRPQVVAVEEVYLARNAPSAMRTAQVLGVVKLLACGCQLREYAPREIKKWVCGTGAAPKEQMMGMMAHILKIEELPTDHAADALAVALCAVMDGRL
ncbi:MAG: crossover junction endodeoxyribonuclease RuvC [Candidatus Bipolaricaulota bacterium]